MKYTLGIVGGGNMGGAIAIGVVRSGTLPADQVIIVEPSQSRRASLAAMIDCPVTDDISLVGSCDQILLAVKPQVFPDLAASIGTLASPTVVISIMAGLASRQIRSMLGENARVVRVMPNTPCQIGAGIAAVSLGAGTEPGDADLTIQLFESVGTCIMVDESHMDAVTALSGSGPAYIFLLAEAMEQAGQQLGLPNAEARILAEQTVIGAARLLSEAGKSASELRQAVTSPNGTTAAALEVMFERELPQIVAEAMLAARDRGQELAQQ